MVQCVIDSGPWVTNHGSLPTVRGSLSMAGLHYANAEYSLVDPLFGIDEPVAVV